MTVAGLALFGGLTSITLAQSPQTPGGYDTINGFGSTVGVQDVKGVVGTKDAGNNAANDGLLRTINRAINWILGMLAVIALAICLRGGFQMVTAAGDDGKYKKGLTILKQAAIGLIIVGISWIIVSFIFWVIGAFATSGQAPSNNQV